MTTLIPNTQTNPSTTGGRLVTADGHTLPLRSAELRTTAGAGLARTRLVQTFTNPHGEPLAVTYQLPLPADGAVSGFAFQIGEQRIVGEVDQRQAARERFETALTEGRTAALIEEDRTSLFTQEIGNIPAHATIVAEIDVDQPLTWHTGGWEWRFPTTVAPRYLGGAGRVQDAERVAVDVADGATPARLGLALQIDDSLAGPPTSPSHDLAIASAAARTSVTLGESASARLDRDVVVRWPVASDAVGTSLRTTRRDDASYGLLTLVPPKVVHDPVPRDVIVLLDTSGSMHGEPLQQAQRVVNALIATMRDRDQLELIEFSTHQRAFTKHAIEMDAANRAKATAWVDALQAGGATEMRSAIHAALAPLRDESQRQIVLVSDGLIGFETEIVAEILDELPGGSRVHTVGVGSAVNRTLTEGAARAGRGVEAIVALGEDPTEAAQKIVAATDAPTVVDLQVRGSAVRGVAPERLPDLFAGQPARISVELAPEGGELLVSGRTATGTWEQTLTVAPSAAMSPEIAVRFARESVADLEMRVATGRDVAELDAKIEAIGMQFQVATRCTSWVAVSENVTVDPQQPTRDVRMPHELPHGMSVEGLGLRSPMAFPVAVAAPCAAEPPSAPKRTSRSRSILGAAGSGAAEIAKKIFHLGDGMVGGGADADDFDAHSEEVHDDEPLILVGKVKLDRDGFLVIEIESDGRNWQQPDAVWLRFEDDEIEVRLVEKRTTRSGPTTAGVTIRLALKLPEERASAAGATELRLQTDAGETIVALPN